MTPEEILETGEQSRTTAGWLREIAYQLALLNKLLSPQSLKRKYQ